ncbi:MAG: YcfL family protein [Victivallaceae bacterium]
MKSKILLGCSMLALILGVAGCQSSVNTIENAQKNSLPNAIADKRIITDSFLQNRLKVTNCSLGYSASGNLAVTITAINTRTGFFSEMWSSMTGENPYKVDYKFTWYDQNGLAVNSNLSAWVTKTIYPGETVQFYAVAPIPNCGDFVLNLKESNNY